MTGRVVHFEIPYDDGDRARQFYREVFGWDVVELPGMDYTMVTTGPTDPGKGPTERGFVNGGMLRREDEWSSPNVVIEVADLEDALESVVGSGGTLVQARQQVGDMGFSAYFKDSEGNLVGLWEPATGS